LLNPVLVLGLASNCSEKGFFFCVCWCFSATCVNCLTFSERLPIIFMGFPSITFTVQIINKFVPLMWKSLLHFYCSALFYILFITKILANCQIIVWNQGDIILCCGDCGLLHLFCILVHVIYTNSLSTFHLNASIIKVSNSEIYLFPFYTARNPKQVLRSKGVKVTRSEHRWVKICPVSCFQCPSGHRTNFSGHRTKICPCMHIYFFRLRVGIWERYVCLSLRPSVRTITHNLLDIG
jgi:hypothetical protein